MTKPTAAQSSADEAYWNLVDERARLMSERVALSHADGRPRGFAMLGWESPTRRRASALAAEIDETNERFEKERARFAASMRRQSAVQATAMREALGAQVAEAAARPTGEFAAQRVQARAMAAMDFDDAATLRALEQKTQNAGGGKR
jgi:hypothetical protein